MALVALTAVGLCLDSLPAGRQRGRFPLRITLVGPPGKPIAAVAAGTETEAGRASSYLDAPGHPPIEMAAATWSEGQPFEVGVPWVTDVSLLSGRELTSRQRRALVLRPLYQAGTSQ